MDHHSDGKKNVVRFLVRLALLPDLVPGWLGRNAIATNLCTRSHMPRHVWFIANLAVVSGRYFRQDPKSSIVFSLFEWIFPLLAVEMLRVVLPGAHFHREGSQEASESALKMYER
jgi:hypothetical protein